MNQNDMNQNDMNQTGMKKVDQTAPFSDF